MKKSNNNTWTQTLRTAAFIAFAMLITTVKLSASENNNDSLKAEKKVSKAEVMMIEDLLEALEEMDAMENIDSAAIPAVEVYGSNDELLFSGTQAQWETQQATDMIAAKRKAELLFELDGTSVYKVF